MGCNSSSAAADYQAQESPSPAREGEEHNYYLEKSQLKALKNLYTSLDKNNDGKISPEYAVDALYQFGITTSTDILQKLILLVDDNNDGYVYEIEFLRLYICMLINKKDKYDPLMLYVAADYNMDGTIQHHELVNCCEKLGMKARFGDEEFDRIIYAHAKNYYTRDEYFNILEAFDALK